MRYRLAIADRNIYIWYKPEKKEFGRPNGNYPVVHIHKFCSKIAWMRQFFSQLVATNFTLSTDKNGHLTQRIRFYFNESVSSDGCDAIFGRTECAHICRIRRKVVNLFTCYARITFNFKREWKRMAEKKVCSVLPEVFLASMFSSNFGGKHAVLPHSKMISVFYSLRACCLFGLDRLLPKCAFSTYYVTKLRLEAVNLWNMSLCVCVRAYMHAFVDGFCFCCSMLSPFLVCSFYYIVIFIMHNVWLLPSFAVRKNAGKLPIRTQTHTHSRASSAAYINFILFQLFLGEIDRLFGWLAH